MGSRCFALASPSNVDYAEARIASAVAELYITLKHRVKNNGRAKTGLGIKESRPSS